MKIAIIDASIDDQNTLISYLHTYEQQSACSFSIDTFLTGEDFLKNFQPMQYAIIFLDVFLGDGIAIAEKIRGTDSRTMLIFTSVTAEFAIHGYSVSAVGYLLKPIDYKPFNSTLSRLISSHEPSTAYIEVKTGRSVMKIFLADIIYCDYYNHYIQIHTNGPVIRSHIKFADLFHTLDSYPQFLYCYRNIIINMDCVSKMENNYFIMNDNSAIPMKRENRAKLKDIYNDYIFQKRNGQSSL